MASHFQCGTAKHVLLIHEESLIQMFILNPSPLYAVRSFEEESVVADSDEQKDRQNTFIRAFCDERRHKCRKKNTPINHFFIDSILFESRNNDKINLMADAKVSKQFMVEQN